MNFTRDEKTLVQIYDTYAKLWVFFIKVSLMHRTGFYSKFHCFLFVCLFFTYNLLFINKRLLLSVFYLNLCQ